MLFTMLIIGMVSFVRLKAMQNIKVQG